MIEKKLKNQSIPHGLFKQLRKFKYHEDRSAGEPDIMRHPPRTETTWSITPTQSPSPTH